MLFDPIYLQLVDTKSSLLTLRNCHDEINFDLNMSKTRVLNDKNIVFVNKISILFNIEQFMMSNSVLMLILELLTLNLLWRCHIAPAKPNGPIPFDLNDKGEISEAK